MTGQVICCQVAPDELLEQEAEQYDCSACLLQQQVDALDEDNKEAWALYLSCCNRFTQDLQAGAVVLDRLTQHLSADEFRDMSERLRIIYDVVSPPRKETPR
jgi:hypothetical protein